jgi:hypothetical protein
MKSETDLQVGDKVKLKPSAKHDVGRRGIVLSCNDGAIVVQLENGEEVSAESSELSNYSLAARKAWLRMPDRKVGRPKGSGVGDRISVTIRFERALWEAFLEKERSGEFQSRTAVLNQVLREIITHGSADRPRKA